MIKFKVEPVVCDFGLFRIVDGKEEMIEIFNSSKNAEAVKKIMLEDRQTIGMDEMKTYDEWKKVWQKENKIKIIDDNGAIELADKDMLDALMNYKEACEYLIKCTVSNISKGESIDK